MVECGRGLWLFRFSTILDHVTNLRYHENNQTKRATTGPGWFDMPRTVVTPELKRDMQLLKMRDVLDPKRHYKKDTSASSIPTYSQVGTIIAGPTDFYSGRLTKREQKATILGDVLAGEKRSGKFRAKYDEIQEKKRSGKKGYYKALQAKRTAKFKRG